MQWPPLTPTLTEEWYTPLAPGEVLRRLGYRTAPGKLGSLAGGLLTYQSYRHNSMHHFAGNLTADGFTLQQLAQAGGRGRWVQFATARRVTVVGPLLGQPEGTRVVLCYTLPPLSLPLLLVGLVGWLWQQSSSPGYALLRLVLLAAVGWLAPWGTLRLGRRALRAALAELLRLQLPEQL